VSVGTFLYVATIRIFPEVFPERMHDHGLSVKTTKADNKSTKLSDIKEEPLISHSEEAIF